MSTSKQGSNIRMRIHRYKKYAPMPDGVWEGRRDQEWLRNNFTYVMKTLLTLRGVDTPVRLLEDYVRPYDVNNPRCFCCDDESVLNDVLFALKLGSRTTGSNGRLSDYYPLFRRYFAEQHVDWLGEPMSDAARLRLVSLDLDQFVRLVTLDRVWVVRYAAKLLGELCYETVDSIRSSRITSYIRILSTWPEWSVIAIQLCQAQFARQTRADKYVDPWGGEKQTYNSLGVWQGGPLRYVLNDDETTPLEAREKLEAYLWDQLDKEAANPPATIEVEDPMSNACLAHATVVCDVIDPQRLYCDLLQAASIVYASRLWDHPMIVTLCTRTKRGCTAMTSIVQDAIRKNQTAVVRRFLPLCVAGAFPSPYGVNNHMLEPASPYAHPYRTCASCQESPIDGVCTRAIHKADEKTHLYYCAACFAKVDPDTLSYTQATTQVLDIGLLHYCAFYKNVELAALIEPHCSIRKLEASAILTGLVPAKQVLNPYWEPTTCTLHLSTNGHVRLLWTEANVAYLYLSYRFASTLSCGCCGMHDTALPDAEHPRRAYVLPRTVTRIELVYTEPPTCSNTA
jgi:hypothetical protein